MTNSRTSLPITAVIDDIKQALADNDNLVLEAPPGAGKTTWVPLALLNEPWLHNKKILMLEPRRIATRAAADRMANLLNEPVGKTVGYRVRMEKKVSHETKIEIVTEGILNRMLIEDPALEDVGLLIFDEFHERSLDADLGLALSLQGRELFSELRESPLKILVMSATLNGEEISQLLDHAPIVCSQGKSFPVDIKYAPPPIHRIHSSVNRQDAASHVSLSILKALANETGSLLVFLPGKREIDQVAQQLENTIKDPSVLITPLYGALTLTDQRKAIEPAPNGMRKVVLTTSIAETSLTIEGVRVVIDAGLSRLPVYDPKTAMTRLTTKSLSAAASKQRAGRAGRVEPGVCYRLWSEAQQNQLAPFTPPEITQADLVPLTLQLLQWGISDAAELSWLTPPSTGAMTQAMTLLKQLGAIAQNGHTLTKHGKEMASMPVHPRLAHMLVRSIELGCSDLACQLAALLSERDPIFGTEKSVDIMQRLERIHHHKPSQAKGLIKQILALAQQFHHYLSRVSEANGESEFNQEEQTALLIAMAYPDRIAGKSSGSAATYKLSNGRQASLPETDNFNKHRYLAVAELGGRDKTSHDHIYMAVPLNLSLLESVCPELFTHKTVVEWDEKNNRLIGEKQRYIGKLRLDAVELPSIPQAQKNKALLGLIKNKGLTLLPWTDELLALRARVETIRPLQADQSWPDMSDAGLLNHLEDWLLPYLDDISHINHFKKLDLKTILTSHLGWECTRTLDTLAPEKIAVPSGSKIRIDYQQSPPVLAVKLQEMFGQQTSPTIANGKIKLVVHLLSPAQRPLQVTQDLEGFWKSSYQAVRKDMRGRYPKHPWPEDPLHAEPTGKTKKNIQKQ